MASNYPLLPGFAPTQQFKDHYKKISATKQQKNRDVNNNQPTRYPLPRQPQYIEPNNVNQPYLSTTHDHFNAKNVPRDTSQLYQPDWVHLDRHVLRFFGGMPVGKYFLRRQKCIGPNGKFINAYDFKIGQTINIYGRNIYLYDCDGYTREFYQKLSIPQGPSQSYDNDQWTKKVNEKWIPKKDALMKEYLQKKLGGGKVNSEKQFLQNDRKVLKFFARFEGAPYIVHYFLADDTIEVRQVSLPNSGKDPFPVTFKRQKLPRQFALNQPGQTYAQNFLKAEELFVGQPLAVFGRQYILQGCDQFTRNYFAAKFGIVQPQNIRSQQGHGQERARIIIPPHNGIGSEQDSLGYIYKLVPKPPKKDFFKWVDQQVSLRFTAAFSSPKPEDAIRKFIITYYLNDDSLQIYEPPTKNSGFSTGKFLERGPYKNQQGDVYKPEHLIIGQDVKINGYQFHLTDCDDFTKKWYAQNTVWERVSY